MIVDLKSGGRIHIREIRESDKDLLQKGLARLSEDSVYKRFFTPKTSFSSTELKYLTEVDGRDHSALVAIDEGGDMVGVARYIRHSDDIRGAEVAIVIADHLQGKGLGKQIGLALADKAKDQGITYFTATMLGDNRAAHRLMYSLTKRVRDGEKEAGRKNLVVLLNED